MVHRAKKQLAKMMDEWRKQDEAAEKKEGELSDSVPAEPSSA